MMTLSTLYFVIYTGELIWVQLLHQDCQWIKLKYIHSFRCRRFFIDSENFYHSTIRLKNLWFLAFLLFSDSFFLLCVCVCANAHFSVCTFESVSFSPVYINHNLLSLITQSVDVKPGSHAGVISVVTMIAQLVQRIAVTRMIKCGLYYFSRYYSAVIAHHGSIDLNVTL